MKKIRYSRKRLQIHIKMGLTFIVIGIILMLLPKVFKGFTGIDFESIGFGQIAAGIFMVILYYFENKNQYLTFTNGQLIKHSLIPKKINLINIEVVNKFAGDYILITDKGEFIIDTQIIDPNSLMELREELKNLNVAWN